MLTAGAHKYGFASIQAATARLEAQIVPQILRGQLLLALDKIHIDNQDHTAHSWCTSE